LGYQQFDEIPKLVETRNEVSKEPLTEQPEVKEAPSSVNHELQDQSSEVSSLNKDVKETTPIKPTPISGPITDVPYYQIKPKYPKEALLSGLEGHVLLKVDINEDGSVENIRVTGGEKLNVFEIEAKRAVVKWKYKPFLNQEGSPIKMQNHQVRVDFKLVDEQVVKN
ncbi:MAG: TonB family protein, partial [Bdellovibrionaceae bacterium]|nr:TonB family protein [Pseudobdellovibrionaceae bacterium]